MIRYVLGLVALALISAAVAAAATFTMHDSIAPFVPGALQPSAPTPTDIPTAVPTAIPTVGPHCYVVILSGPQIPQGPPQATVAFYGPENDYLCVQMVGITDGGFSAAQIAGSNYKNVACARAVGDNIVRVWSDNETWGKAVCTAYDRHYAGVLAARLSGLIIRRASGQRL